MLFRSSDEKKNIFYDEQFYSPKIKVTKLTYGATVSAERYHILCESLEYSYVLSGDTIYRMKKQEMAVQKILELCLVNNLICKYDILIQFDIAF